MADEAEIFDCRQCGYCCHGESTVSLDEHDVARMCDYLKMDFAELCEKYLRVTGKVIQMKIVDGHCVFYDNGCTIHPGKPWRCSQWPIHPSMLVDEANFSAISSSCPGIKKELGYRRFSEILRQVIAKQKF
ncbi:MAG: Fe-S oxidoreductase [Desulfobulbaceae bacterium]|nr:MAG: Fe-S oxidoreductase [Desulfobulbaceae bacterium]